jgi:hypothetical protein
LLPSLQLEEQKPHLVLTQYTRLLVLVRLRLLEHHLKASNTLLLLAAEAVRPYQAVAAQVAIAVLYLEKVLAAAHPLKAP